MAVAAPAEVLCDVCLVSADWCERVGRFVRTTRDVVRGEVILVEAPAFITPTSDACLDKLVHALCDPVQVDLERKRHHGAKLPVPWVLALVAIKNLSEETDGFHSFAARQLTFLDGDVERWHEMGERVWSLLLDSTKAKVEKQQVLLTCGAVGMNAHSASQGCAAVFLTGSLIEHSCAPNAFKEIAGVRSRDGSTQDCLIVRALRGLEKGEAVSISYVPEYMPTWKRRQTLEAYYGFTCTCVRCSAGFPELVCAYRCPHCGHGPCSPIDPMLFSDGHSPRYEAISDSPPVTALKCEECEALVDDPEDLDAFTAAERCEFVCQDCIPHFHPFHHKIFNSYLGALRKMSCDQLVTALSQLKEAQKRLIAVSEISSHPSFARYAEMAANGLADSGNYEGAKSELMRALECYEMSHNGPPDGDLRIAQCRRKLAKLESRLSDTGSSA